MRLGNILAKLKAIGRYTHNHCARITRVRITPHNPLTHERPERIRNAWRRDSEVRGDFFRP